MPEGVATADGGRAAAAGFQWPEAVPWSELGEDFIEAWGRREDGRPDWEHLEATGQSGSGKTYAIGTILQQRAARWNTAELACLSKNTDDSIRLSKRAERLGADGVMIIPPFYCTPTEDELFEHYRRIGDAIGIGAFAVRVTTTLLAESSPSTKTESSGSSWSECAHVSCGCDTQLGCSSDLECALGKCCIDQRQDLSCTSGHLSPDLGASMRRF